MRNEFIIPILGQCEKRTVCQLDGRDTSGFPQDVWPAPVDFLLDFLVDTILYFDPAHV